MPPQFIHFFPSSSYYLLLALSCIRLIKPAAQLVCSATANNGLGARQAYPRYSAIQVSGDVIDGSDCFDNTLPAPPEM